VSGAPSYHAGIDGLRAVAVSAVVIYHAMPAKLSGGFIGVDVFFVISGFLITRLLMQDIASGSYSLFKFYERRARRLLPALLAVLAATFIYASFVFLPIELKTLSASSAAAVLFVSNMFFWSQTGYFAAHSNTLPLWLCFDLM